MTAQTFAQEINLFPAAVPRASVALPAHWIGKLSLATALALSLAWVQTLWQTSQTTAELDALLAEGETLSAQVADLEVQARARTVNPVFAADVRSLGDKVRARQALLESLAHPSGQQEGFSSHLTGLARRTVRGLWLESFEIRNGGTELALFGRALAPDAVPELLERLREEPVFVGREFRTFRLAASEEGVLDFVIDSKQPDPRTARSGGSS